MDIKKISKEITKQQLGILLLIFIGVLVLLVVFYQQQNIPTDLEQQARAFLVEKYHPGACYGMPRVVHKGEAPPQPKIELSQKDKTSFEYEVWDGHCCGITIYKGILTYSNKKFSDNLISNKTEIVPC